MLFLVLICYNKVGPHGKPGDLIAVLRLGRQHKDGKLPIFADLCAQADPGNIGKHHVQHRQVDFFPLQYRQRLPSGSTGKDPKILPPKVNRHQIGDLRLVIHNQNVSFHPPHPFLLFLYYREGPLSRQAEAGSCQKIFRNAEPSSF